MQEIGENFWHLLSHFIKIFYGVSKRNVVQDLNNQSNKILTLIAASKEQHWSKNLNQIKLHKKVIVEGVELRSIFYEFFIQKKMFSNQQIEKMPKDLMIVVFFLIFTLNKSSELIELDHIQCLNILQTNYRQKNVLYSHSPMLKFGRGRK